MDNVLDTKKHEVKVIDRSLIYLTGIDKIVSFDPEEFLLESVMGTIVLKGESLEIVKLDTHDGVVTIKGMVHSFIYDEGKKNDSDTFIGKLFK